jgi:hypothetical protein
VVEHLRAILLAQAASADLVEASTEDQTLYSQQAALISRQTTMRAIRAFNKAINDYKGGWQPQLTLELALIDSIRGGEQEHIGIVQQSEMPSPNPEKPVPDAPQVEVTPPGTPPVISPATIHQKWGDMLTALYKRNQSAPEVVKAYRVHHVDGNLVYICTDDEFLFGRLDGELEKLGVIERAFYDVHRIGLRVQVILVDNLEQIAEAQQTDSDEVDDPLVRLGLDELGAQITDDDE